MKFKCQPGVYLITNLKDSKQYVGSSVNVSSRIINHKWCLRKGVHINKKLQYAWNKYGSESFTFEVLEYCLIEDQVLKEQYWIEEIKPYYNILTQAFSSKGFKHNNEKIQLMKMLKDKVAKEVAQISIHTLKVVKKWNSIREASQTLGIDRQSISNCCKFKRQYGQGFIWRYWEDREKVEPIKKNQNYDRYIGSKRIVG